MLLKAVFVTIALCWLTNAEKVDDVHARISEVFHNQLGLDAKQYNVSHLVPIASPEELSDVLFPNEPRAFVSVEILPPSLGYNPADALYTGSRGGALPVLNATLTVELPSHRLPHTTVNVFTGEEEGELIGKRFFRHRPHTRTVEISLDEYAVERKFRENDGEIKLFVQVKHSGQDVSEGVVAKELTIVVQQKSRGRRDLVEEAVAAANAGATAGRKCGPDSQQTGCCLNDYTIDFEAAGWGKSIVMPKQLNIGICQGSCAPAPEEEENMNTKLTRQVLMKDGGSSCCHPKEFEKVLVMFRGKDGVVKTTTIEDLVVTRCGC